MQKIPKKVVPRIKTKKKLTLKRSDLSQEKGGSGWAICQRCQWPRTTGAGAGGREKCKFEGKKQKI